MRVNRGHLLLAFGLLAGGVGLAVIVEPGILPPEVEQLRSVLDEQTVSRFAIGLATFVVLVAIFRLLRAKPEDVDRSSIADTPPELVTAGEPADVDRRARLAYDRALEGFDSPDHSTRLVAIYGRRAGSVTEIDAEIEDYLDELAATAAETYATAVGCDEETATRAIETGRWTDDRVAAAFLATDLDGRDSFTAWERFNAWLAPERAFRTRLRRVLGEIERYAGTYLTYEEPAPKSTGGPAQTARESPSEQTGATSRTRPPRGTEHARADGGNETQSGTDTRQSTPEGRDE